MSTQTIATAVVETRRAGLWGLCPRCYAWFDCTGWSELSAPPCPRCASPAQYVVRAGAPGDPEPPSTGVPETWIG